MPDPSFRLHLPHRVTLQRMSTAPDDYGQEQPTWGDVGTYHANVQPLSGRELVNARAVRADVTHKVTLRYLGQSTTIYPEDRFLYKGRVFNVDSAINVDERNFALECVCIESKVSLPVDTSAVYYGTSASTSLDGTGIAALSSGQYTLTNWQTSFAFGSGNYKYFALPSSYGTLGTIVDTVTGFEMAMAGTAEGYTSTAHGINYSVVSVSGVNYNVYRSEYPLGAAITVQVAST